MNSSDFLIGADPEIVLVKPDDTLLKVRGVIPEQGQFGVDGHGYIAELRPEPAMFPKDLTENLRIALASRYHALKDYRWRAGPWLYEKPLGGHIHFGVDMDDLPVEALEKLMPIILVLIEPHTQARQRRSFPFYRSTPYGLLGDVRAKNWGWEWRVPSSFIISPGVTTAVLALCKAIIYEEITNGKNAYNNLSAAARNLLRFRKSDFNDCNRKKFLPLLPPLWNMFQEYSYFQKENEGSTLWSNVAYLKRFVIEKGGLFVPKDIKSKSKWNIAASAPPAGKTDARSTENGGAVIREMTIPTVRFNDLTNPDTIFTPNYIMRD